MSLFIRASAVVSMALAALSLLAGCQLFAAASQDLAGIRGQWIDGGGVGYEIRQTDTALTITNRKTGVVDRGEIALFGVVRRTLARPGGGETYVQGVFSAASQTIAWDGGAHWSRPPADVEGMERDTRFGDNEYRDFDVAGLDPAACRNACRADADCLAFRFAFPNAWPGGKPHCWLMNGAPDRRAEGGYYSGAIQYRIDANRPRRLLRHFASIDEIDCRITNESGEDEIYIRANIDGLGFRKYGPAERSMNEDSEKRYWRPGLRWEFSNFIIIEIWEDDELVGSKRFTATDEPGSDHEELFADNGVYGVRYSKGPVYEGGAGGAFTQVIENATTIKVASGIKRNVAQEIIGITGGDWTTGGVPVVQYAAKAVSKAGGLVTEYVGYAIDVTNWVATTVTIVDELLAAPDQLQIRLDGQKIFPAGDAPSIDSKVGQLNHVRHVKQNAKGEVLEPFELDKGDVDSLGQFFINPAVAPRFNDPRTVLVLGDANEASVYHVTMRLYQDDPGEFCRLYRDRDVSLRAQEGFVHGRHGGKPHIVPQAGPAFPLSRWRVDCVNGVVTFTGQASEGRGRLGATLGADGWVPLRQFGTDRWAFRRVVGGKSSDAAYLEGLSRDMRVTGALDRWSRFVVEVAGKPAAGAPMNQRLRITQALRDACLATGAAKDGVVGVDVSFPCAGATIAWRLEPSNSGRHEHAGRVRAERSGDARFLRYDPKRENLVLAPCADTGDDGCYWYVDRSWNLPGEGEFYLRTAAEDFLAVAADLRDKPKERQWAKSGKLGRDLVPPNGYNTFDLLPSAPAFARSCERDVNDKECQWRFVVE